MAQSHTLSVRRKDQDGNSVPASQDEAKMAKEADEAKAAKERSEGAVSQPGGFDNDPDDATNPNEAIERHRRKLRP